MLLFFSHTFCSLDSPIILWQFCFSPILCVLFVFYGLVSACLLLFSGNLVIVFFFFMLLRFQLALAIIIHAGGGGGGNNQDSKYRIS